jgi:vancomycin resistance protein VanJ
MNRQESFLDLQILKSPSRIADNRWWKFVARSVLVSVWCYIVVIFGMWALLRFGGDRWWLATVLLFGPQWFLAVPLPILVVAAAVFWRRGLWLLMIAATILLIPIMGFCLPWRCIVRSPKPIFRVLTCNVGGQDFSKSALIKLIEQEQPDFIALQECTNQLKFSDIDNYFVIQRGELLVASRFPLQLGTELSGSHPSHTYFRHLIMSCVADTPQGKTTFCSLHLPSARYGLSHILDKTTIINPSKSGLLTQQVALRREQSQAVASIVKKLTCPVILAGDFNMPEESAIYREDWSEYKNAFSRSGWAFGYTFTGEVRGIPFRIRIDHILCNAAWTPVRCWVGPNVGSDHLPFISDLAECN